MDKCFVIQPFDNDKFDRRFDDTFKPAILKAELDPYRIDKDLSVRIPIDEIEKGIMESVMCFAEITTDNPNVWYELGFAFACKKDVVMVCSEERVGKFPFDIQHRQIITYKANSRSDFEKLEDSITNKIIALRQKTIAVESLNITPVVDKEGLRGHEIAIIILLAQNQFTSEESVAIYNLKKEMNNAGYTDIATSVGIKALVKKRLITTLMTSNSWDREEYPAISLTQEGEDWVLSNEDQFVFRMEKPAKDNEPQGIGDDLPF